MVSDLSLLPPNATPLERALEVVTRRAFDVPVPVKTVWDPETCPVELLPWLAWAFAVDQWDSRWSEVQKRAVVGNAIAIHRYRGTLGAVKRAIASLGYDITIREWFEESPRRDPFTFRAEVRIADSGVELPLYRQLEQLINDAKNVRSHLTGVTLVGVTEVDLFLGVDVISGNEVEIGAFDQQHIDSYGSLNVAVGIAMSVNVTVFPE